MEYLLRLPAHLVEHPDDAVGAKVLLPGPAVTGEGEPKRGVHAFLLEDVQQFGEVARLLVLVRDRAVRHLPGHAATFSRALVRAGSVLGHRDGLAVGEVPTQLVPEAVGVVGSPVGIDADEVEGTPVDELPGGRGIGDLPAEVRTDGHGDLGEEVVEAFLHRSEGGPPLHVGAGHGPQAVAVGVAWEETAAEGADLAAGDEHHIGASLPYGFGPSSAVGEEREQLVAGKVHGKGGEPDLKARVCSVPGSDAQPFRLSSGDTNGVAVKIPGDHCHVVPDRLRGEALAGEFFPWEKPGVVVDAPCAHVHVPSLDRCRVPTSQRRARGSWPEGGTATEGGVASGRTQGRAWQTIT
ncbi:hypothetical protein ACFV8T_44770 [Streptomyces sp. NPDC059832]|uniref:hypothetical protein n=1 Tax=Streptomyces sp. NPDC059832 TaxID=3346966 RepID=UPI0036474181